MVAGSFSFELVVAVSADRMWKAAVCDDHNLLPKILPGFFAGAELEGNNIKVFKFTPAVEKATYIKSHVEVADQASRTTKYKIVEGGSIGKRLSKEGFEAKYEASGADSCVVKFKVEYETIGDTPLSEEEEKHNRESNCMVVKAIEGHLIANPAAYA